MSDSSKFDDEPEIKNNEDLDEEYYNFNVDEVLNSDLVEKLSYSSLFIFPAHNKFRIICNKIINSNKFLYFILILIVLSSILLAIENPLDT